ncbi:MAG: hypothetical protein SVV67_06370 [Bacillota bacterium]|nr:hypothetical protein [Bacillota bacterium]
MLYKINRLLGDFQAISIGSSKKVGPNGPGAGLPVKDKSNPYSSCLYSKQIQKSVPLSGEPRASKNIFVMNENGFCNSKDRCYAYCLVEINYIMLTSSLMF